MNYRPYPNAERARKRVGRPPRGPSPHLVLVDEIAEWVSAEEFRGRMRSVGQSTAEVLGLPLDEHRTG
ncbi:hypothetical protein ACFRH6_14475 [Streptomyces sp. NPDC056749]|uniref:hypothetical protein n=1 Tax=Streptomyces sp. NPDC056749 TaxID=3345936 RepID=UPI003676C30B